MSLGPHGQQLVHMHTCVHTHPHPPHTHKEAVLKVGAPSPPPLPSLLPRSHTEFSKISNRLFWAASNSEGFERKCMMPCLARPGLPLQSDCIVPLVTDDHGPRIVKSQLITCHRAPALHWAIFTSAVITMSFHPRLARPSSPSVGQEWPSCVSFCHSSPGGREMKICR